MYLGKENADMQTVLKKTMLVAACCMLLSPLASVAQTNTGTGSSSPIRVEADRMVSMETENSVLFSGNVDARQDDVVIRSDEMTVYYEAAGEASGDGKKNSQQVKKLICKGNVQITRADWLGTGKRMDYIAKDRKVILSGDAKAWQHNNMVSGKTIVYYLDEKRSIVEKDPEASGRVIGVFQTNE